MQRDIVEVAPGVLVTTSRRDMTSSTLVLNGDFALMVDPAWEPDELDWLAEFVIGMRYRVRAGVATHAHHDHVLWHPIFGEAPRWASLATVDAADAHRAELIAALGPDWPPRLTDVVARLLPVADDGIVPFGEDVQLITHDGHAPGHSAVWLPGRRVLLAGDMLSDVELPLALGPTDPDGAPLKVDALAPYFAGLDALAPYVALAEVLVPGHGRPSHTPLDRLDADRRYLDAIVAGADPADPRRANRGMADVHAQLRALVTT